MSNENDPPKTLAERVATLESDVGWIKTIVKKIDDRMWWVLGSVVGLGLLAVLLAILPK